MFNRHQFPKDYRSSDRTKFDMLKLKLANERFIVLFHDFFLQIAEIGQKAYNTTTARPSVQCILQMLTIFNLYSGRPRVGLSVDINQKVRQAMVKISREAWQPPPLPSLNQICQPKLLG